MQQGLAILGIDLQGFVALHLEDLRGLPGRFGAAAKAVNYADYDGVELVGQFQYQHLVRNARAETV